MLPKDRIGFGLSNYDEGMLKELFALNAAHGKDEDAIMKTDVYSKNGHYVIEVEMPGFKKEDIKISIENNYLTIEGKIQQHADDTGEKGTYIRKERVVVTEACRRFYVGDVKDDDVTAAFVNGVLIITFPDLVDRPKQDKKKNIQIT
jgi:HSP20 family molecular chaperone IbpA